MAKGTMWSAGGRSHPVAPVGSEGSGPMREIAEGQSVRDGAAVFVAMELSKSAWLLAVQGSPSGKTSSHRVEGADVDGLLALLRRLQARERQALRRLHAREQQALRRLQARRSEERRVGNE